LGHIRLINILQTFHILLMATINGTNAKTEVTQMKKSPL
jgi:hypothetical protein